MKPISRVKHGYIHECVVQSRIKHLAPVLPRNKLRDHSGLRRAAEEEVHAIVYQPLDRCHAHRLYYRYSLLYLHSFSHAEKGVGAMPAAVV